MEAKLLTAFVLVTLVAVAYASAQELTATSAGTTVDSVILTTKSHYPDSIVAGAVGNKIGAPVFVTSQGNLDSDVLAEINELSPSTVYIVGGPEAISEDVETQLAANYDVVRIWGMTRYGTSAELAQYFWETSDKVILVWDVLGLADAGNYEMLSDVRDLAIQEDLPVLLIRKNDIPDQVVDTLVNMSVESVVLVGNVGSRVTYTLDSLGITVDEQIKGTDPQETRERIREKVKENLRKKPKKHLVVVAAGNWTDSVKAPFITNGSAMHITSEDQIDDLIAEINDMNYTSIKIVGKPELAQTIYDRLTEAGIDADLISARDAAAASVAVMKKELARIKAKENAVRDKLRQMFERRVKAKQDEADATFRRTEAFIQNSGLSDEVKQRFMNWLSEKKTEFDSNVEDGNYVKAWQDFNNMKMKISEIAYKYRTRLVTAYRDLREQETQLRTTAETLRTLRDRIPTASQR